MDKGLNYGYAHEIDQLIPDEGRLKFYQLLEIFINTIWSIIMPINFPFDEWFLEN